MNRVHQLAGHLYLPFVAGILVIAGITFWFAAGSTPKDSTVVATVSDVVQKVSITGKTRSAQAVTLGFPTTGKINHVYALAGETVRAGSPLVSIDADELRASLAQARASAEAASVGLSELKRGARQEDLQVSTAKVQSSAAALADAEEAVTVEMSRAYAVSADALFTTIDQLFSNARTNPRLAFAVSDSSLTSTVEDTRRALGPEFAAWNSSIKAAASPDKELEQTTAEHLVRMQSYLDSITLSLNAVVTGSGTTQSQVTAWQASVTAAKASINAEIAAFQAARDARNRAREALAVATSEAGKTSAGNSVESIMAQEARVKQYQAQVTQIEAALSETTLMSPVDGVVSRQDAKIGQIVTPAASVVSMIGDSPLELEAFVPELSIGKIALGNAVVATFDAYPDITAEGSITYIDPAETVIDGISNYKIKVALKAAEPRLRSGLTANITVISNAKKNVVTIPSYAISITKTGKSAQVLRDGKAVEVPIITGLVGQDGTTEVVSGIGAGDAVVVPFIQ